MIFRIALCLVGLCLASCDRQPSQGELEIAAELRALRLASGAATRADSTPPIDREGIAAALAPMREVFGQLGQGQRELADRQAMLTREMRSWTSMLVESMQEKQAEQGRQLVERLEQLEKTMAAQDARHREVEALMQAALDATADRLEEFLRRVGAMRDAGGAPAGGGQPVPAGDPTGGRGSEAADTGAGAPAVVPAPAVKPGGGDGEEEPRQGASNWLWGSLAALSVFLGILLLQRGRRRRPVSMAPEMQIGYGHVGAPSPSAPADEREVEDLWATAALLGEAIGRLKAGSSGASATETEPTLPAATAPEADVPRDVDNGSAVAGDVDPGDDPAQFPDDLIDLDELFVIEEQDLESATPSGSGMTESSEASGHAPAPTSAPGAITCRVAVADPAAGEAALLGVLRAEPRILVEPPPSVRPAPGGLQVSYALLPGLPAGERSLIVQRLRDSVA